MHLRQEPRGDQRGRGFEPSSQTTKRTALCMHVDSNCDGYGRSGDTQTACACDLQQRISMPLHADPSSWVVLEQQGCTGAAGLRWGS
eukprot:1160973-Pelagomonas_calceolata.AAC.1